MLYLYRHLPMYVFSCVSLQIYIANSIVYPESHTDWLRFWQQNQLQLATVSTCFGISLKYEDSAASLGKLLRSDDPHSKKSFFLCMSRIFLRFGLFLLPLVLALHTTERSLAPSSVLSTNKYLHILIKPPKPYFIEGTKSSSYPGARSCT